MSDERNVSVKKTILVVDDVALNRSIVNKIFADTHTVLVASDGTAAMEILHRNEVDIVLLDIRIPVMDGYAVIRAMKADSRLEEIPILVTTGAIDKSERKAFELGADDYLAQPYDPYILRKRVENLIDRYELRAMRHALNEKKKAKNLLEELGIAYWEYSVDDGYYHSPEYKKYAISQMEDEKIWDPEAPFAYVHPDDVPLMRKFMQKFPDDEIHKSAVVRCKMLDGTYRWTEMFSFTESSADGQLKRLVSAMRDMDTEWIASRAVEQKNKELNRIIDAISGGIATYRVGREIQLEAMSDGMAKRLDYTPAEVASSRDKDALLYIHPADRVLLKKAAKEVIATGKSQVSAYRIMKKDGSYKWFRAAIYPAGEADGSPLLYEVLTDIAEVNADYEEALNEMNEIVLIADWESREIVYLNQAAANRIGRTIPELLGKKCSQVGQCTEEKCAFCYKEEMTYDALQIWPLTLGKQHYLMKGKRILWNGREAFVEYVSDVTAQYNMTEKTVFERNLLSAATKILFPMCIISNLTRNTYNIVEQDNAMTKKAAVTGRFDDLIEEEVSTVPEEDRGAFASSFSRGSLLKAYAEGRKMVSLTHRQRGDDGAPHWIHSTVVFADQLFNGDLFIITFTYNVDEQKKAEAMVHAALSEAERANRAKTAFLSRVSHDMRTPLNGILGLTTILKDSVTDEKISHDLVELELSGQYLLNLINDTLDVSRIEHGKLTLNPAVCDGRDLFNNAFRLVRTSAMAKNMQIHVSAGELPFTMLYVDSGRIEQILLNIVGNAIKFSPENGHIDISLKNLSVESDTITDILEVRDYGAGMSKEFLPHLFEAFSQEDTTRTSSNQGTGLGMAITKQLVQLMGGDISVQSQPGKGSLFTVTLKLPVATDEQIRVCKQGRIQPEETAGLCHKRILLCEDHPLNTKIATKLLERKGMLVEHAENGAVAVDMFANAAIGYYDAVLMDIRMPVMDGLDATKAIRRLARRDAQEVPIIAMTANAFAEDVRQTQAAGMDAHLSKPIDTQLLYSTLSTQMKRSAACRQKR